MPGGRPQGLKAKGWVFGGDWRSEGGIGWEMGGGLADGWIS